MWRCSKPSFLVPKADEGPSKCITNKADRDTAAKLRKKAASSKKRAVDGKDKAVAEAMSMVM